MSEDKFQIKADRYDKESHVVASVNTIADVICKTIELKPDMELMDFGAGTGLLLSQVAPHVAKISAVDISPSMTEQLRKKEADIPCQVEILEMDLCTQPLDKTYDGIISSMTFHHIEDVPALLVKLKTLLKPGGFIAIADLEPEDGSFHDEDTGVFHLGFEGDFLVKAATEAGFQKAQVCPASIIKKPTRDYPVQLLTAFV